MTLAVGPSCVFCSWHSCRKVLETLPGAVGEYTYNRHECSVLSINPVSGQPAGGIECGAMRLGPCGLEGKYWKPLPIAG